MIKQILNYKISFKISAWTDKMHSPQSTITIININTFHSLGKFPMLYTVVTWRKMYNFLGTYLSPLPLVSRPLLMTRDLWTIPSFIQSCWHASSGTIRLFGSHLKRVNYMPIQKNKWDTGISIALFCHFGFRFFIQNINTILNKWMIVSLCVLTSK